MTCIKCGAYVPARSDRCIACGQPIKAYTDPDRITDCILIWNREEIPCCLLSASVDVVPEPLATRLEDTRLVRNRPKMLRRFNLIEREPKEEWGKP